MININMKKGFTLVELLVVIAIIGIFSSIILASLNNSARDGSEANYKIRFDGMRYYVESYTKEDHGQCVYIAEKEIRYCGDWSVEKINKD